MVLFSLLHKSKEGKEQDARNGADEDGDSDTLKDTLGCLQR